MTKYPVKVEIEAKDQQEAKEKMEALMTLANNASHEDLTYLARKIKEKPSLIKQAKAYLGG